MAWMVFSSLSPSGMLHYQSTNNHAGGLVACTVVSVLESLVVFLLYLVPGKIVGKLHPAVGLAQTRERLLKLKQLVTVVLGDWWALIFANAHKFGL